MKKSSDSLLLHLRQRAESALSRGELEIRQLPLDKIADMEKLLEEFRIYQAELELQNEQLRQAQQQAEQARNQTRLLFQSLPLAGLVLDYRGVINDANDQAINILGLSSQFQVFRYSLYRFIHEENKAYLADMLLNNDSHSQVLKNLKIRKPNGEFIPMDGYFIRLSQNYHFDRYMLLLLVDRSTEAAYEKNKLLMQAMLDNTPAIMMAFNHKSECLLANTALFKATGKSAEDILGYTRAAWLDAKETQVLEEKDQEVLITGNPSLNEESFSFQNQEKRYYVGNRFPLRDQNGRIFGVGVVKTDISEIIATKNHLQAVLNAMPDCLFELDEEGYFYDFHTNQFDLFNLSREQILRKNVFEVLPQQAAQVCMQAIQEAMHKGKSIGQQFSVYLAEGEFWFELSVSLKTREENQKAHFLILLRNITERKSAEHAMKQAELAIAANQAKSEFLSQMSHELRTPLNAILGFAQLLQDDNLNEEQNDSVQEILTAGQHLLDLINDVLDLSKIEARKLDIHLEQVSLHALIAECLSLTQPLTLKNQITLLNETGTMQMVVVLADRLRLKQVLLNLISNAIKYNRPHGKVTIACEKLSSERLKINIIDTGYGISLEQQKKLFQPFERLSAKNSTIEGTGIGLCICKSLIEAMNGNIGLTSVVNEGSCFWIEIPLTSL